MADSTLPYNPYAYVPGGSAPKVAKAIQAAGYANPGPTPVMVPQAPAAPQEAPSAPSGGTQGGPTPAPTGAAQQHDVQPTRATPPRAQVVNVLPWREREGPAAPDSPYRPPTTHAHEIQMS